MCAQNASRVLVVYYHALRSLLSRVLLVGDMRKPGGSDSNCMGAVNRWVGWRAGVVRY